MGVRQDASLGRTVQQLLGGDADPSLSCCPCTALRVQAAFQCCRKMLCSDLYVV